MWVGDGGNGPFSLLSRIVEDGREEKKRKVYRWQWIMGKGGKGTVRVRLSFLFLRGKKIRLYKPGYNVISMMRCLNFTITCVMVFVTHFVTLVKEIYIRWINIENDWKSKLYHLSSRAIHFCYINLSQLKTCTRFSLFPLRLSYFPITGYYNRIHIQSHHMRKTKKHPLTLSTAREIY